MEINCFQTVTKTSLNLYKYTCIVVCCAVLNLKGTIQVWPLSGQQPQIVEQV